MGSDWQHIQLGKICLKIGSGATPRGGKDAYRGGNTALIRSQNIYNDRFTRDGLAYINDLQAHELRNVVVEENDVLLNITGDSVARCCQVDPNVLPARVNQHVAIIRTKPEILDARFLRYVLGSPSMQDHLLALASAGATRNALTKAMIESLYIRAPLISEQRAIAHILGTLDDKIELNRKQNETLEAMARALFKSWFVDFEPVRAKMEGRWKKGSPLPLGEGPGVRAIPPHLLQFARDNRKNATDAEKLIWQCLRNQQLGYKFRRQHPLAPYILDFYCHEKGLVIELDGSQHYTPQGIASDAERTAFLTAQGLQVLRFSNREVLAETEGVLEAVWQALTLGLTPGLTPNPSPSGRGEYLPAHLYDLFPDRLVDSELGEIPEGWEVSALGEVCSYLTRGISPKYIDLGGVSVLNQKCIRDFFIDFSKSRRHDVAQKKIDGRALELGDVLVNSTGVGTLGRVAQVRRLAETTIVDSHITVVRAGHRINPMYLGSFMSMKQPEIEAMGEGSTGQTELSRTKLSKLEILLPAERLLDHFYTHTRKFSESIATNQKDSETLAQLRDTLLPKLISGEIRISDVEYLVGGVR